MPTELADDELLNVPLANLQPGELRRAFLVEAREAEKKHEETVSVQRTLTALQGRQEEETYEKDQMRRREEILLAGIQAREREIIQEAEALDERTIKLADGRRAYVDGDSYRDAEGRELHDADRAEAEQHHLEQPKAATWQEHQDIDRRWQAAEELRDKVENLRAGSDNTKTGKALAVYEKDFNDDRAANQKPKENVPDYGSADYMSAYGLSDGFKQAATGAGGSASNIPVPGQPVPQKTNAFAL